MKITVKIQRYDPKNDKEPYFRKYEVEVDPNDRLLDALMRIKRFSDPTLNLRKSCAHGVCGSDAMVINGTERLACKTLIKDVIDDEGSPVKIEPLKTLPVQKDLMVDQKHFFENYRYVKPFFLNKEEVKEKERIQSPEERALFDDGTKCILCAVCYSACPVVRGINPGFLGPAAIVQATRFNDDSRDRGFEERLSALDYPDGIWPCQNFYQCTRVCPRGIKITKLINQTKGRIVKHRSARGEKVHDSS
ncbi:MAG: succinate dehydrogenase iron-sulfur subunit [Candidatus Aminicenantes bacterium]|jgi:succinate dehydrogenase / fumarate reductase iron-sulfur subunit